MKRVIKWRLKSVILSLICLGFLAVIFMPAPVRSEPISSKGTASIAWDSLTFTGPTLNWLDPTGLDTRGSLSGVAIGLNGEIDPYNSDFIDGALWGNTAFTASNAQATGSAFTNFTDSTKDQLLASSNIVLTGGFSIASVDIAQAVLSGQFTVATGGNLTVTAQYHFEQSLNSLAGGFAYNRLLAGLYLSDFDLGNLLVFDERVVGNLISGVDNFTLTGPSKDGTLSLTWGLVPGTTYDFEGVASTEASAAVPEPGTLFLLGSGLVGLVTTIRRKFKKSFN